MLRLPDDLQPARVKIAVKARKLKTRAVHVRDGQDLLIVIDALVYDLHAELFNNIPQLYRTIRIHRKHTPHLRARPPLF